MKLPSVLNTRPGGGAPCTLKLAPAGRLSLPATVLDSTWPACTLKASACGAGLTTTLTVAVAQLLEAAASQTW